MGRAQSRRGRNAHSAWTQCRRPFLQLCAAVAEEMATAVEANAMAVVTGAEKAVVASAWAAAVEEEEEGGEEEATSGAAVAGLGLVVASLGMARDCVALAAAAAAAKTAAARAVSRLCCRRQRAEARLQQLLKTTVCQTSGIEQRLWRRWLIPSDIRTSPWL